MSQKILITLCENDVAPRFDLATEVLIASLGEDGSTEKSKTMILAHSSADDLCQLIVKEEVQVVICGGIEQEYYEYLSWKKIKVLDSIMGPWGRALQRAGIGELQPGAILHDRLQR